jgi:2-hydroxy-3-keto-5-methylthiopentenyl-1-phosphate phosphatase
MSLEILQAKAELKELVDTFSNLADEKNIPGQMPLFTSDTTVKVYMGEELLFDISGTKQLEEVFTSFTANVKRSYHMNGQHVVKVDGNSATGVLYCQVKVVSEEDGKEIITDHSIRYNDTYVRQNGTWLIKTRISHFMINDRRTLES